MSFFSRKYDKSILQNKYKQLNIVNDGYKYPGVTNNTDLSFLTNNTCNAKEKLIPLGIDIGIKRLAVTSDNFVIMNSAYEDIGIIEATRILEKYSGKHVLVLENLSSLINKFYGKYGIQREKNFVDFYNTLRSKAPEYNIPISIIKSLYTSQQCNKCMRIWAESRKGDIFDCHFCKHICDADHNAALVLVNIYNSN